MPSGTSLPSPFRALRHGIRVLPHEVLFQDGYVVSFMDVQERNSEASLTFLGLFDIGVAEGPWQKGGLPDMHERQPNRPSPIPEPKPASHEGGNSVPGLPRTVHESAKPPPPESGEHQPETETVPASSKRPRGRPKLSEVHLQFTREALRYGELMSTLRRRRNTSVQQPQPESESTPTQPKRRVGRLNWSELTEEEKMRRLERQGVLLRREMRSEMRQEMRQLEATLSEQEIRDVKRLWQNAREGAKDQVTRRSEESIEITIWPHEKERR